MPRTGETRGAPAPAAPERRTSSPGAPGAGRGAALSGEQRGRFRDVLRGQHVEPLNGVDFRVGQGTIIPERYHFYPLPPALLELYPEYRGYDYIIVGREILIIEPGTRRIVDVIED